MTSYLGFYIILHDVLDGKAYKNVPCPSIVYIGVSIFCHFLLLWHFAFFCTIYSSPLHIPSFSVSTTLYISFWIYTFFILLYPYLHLCHLLLFLCWPISHSGSSSYIYPSIAVCIYLCFTRNTEGERKYKYPVWNL